MTSTATPRFTDEQRTGTCAIAPSPELRERWQKELTAARRRAKADDAVSLGLTREPRRLGFNDGVVVPPEQFPAGTSLQMIRNAAADRAPLRGTVRVAVVLADFSDQPMAATTAHFHDLFFSTGVLPHGSVREYYQEVTNGLITLDGAVVGPYRMPQTLAWYANNGSGIGLNGTDFRSPQLALDAAVAADPAVNFGPYDNDGNGFVDAFIVVHAGQGAEVTGSKGDIWSHKSTLAQAYATDGTQIYGYLTIPEDAKIGVSAHELGHLLFGFPDLYDTDYSSEGIGNWCLMAGGSWNGGGDIPAHPSAWCKVNQGWAGATNVSANGPLSVAAVETSHGVYRLWQAGASGAEYFLLENRQPIGYDAALPGSGLLLWHVDENQAGNTDENHYKVGLVQADGNRDLELNHNRGDGGDPFPGSSNVTSVNASSTPNTKSYAGADTCVSLSAISASAATMTATVAVICKAVVKDVKDTRKEAKDHKEVRKDLKDHRKDHKEVAKDAKDVSDAPKQFTEAAGPFGGAAADDLTQRVIALEAAVYGGLPGQAAEPFIDASLRPDLIGAAPAGAGGTAAAAHLEQRMAVGDATAKREFDNQPR